MPRNPLSPPAWMTHVLRAAGAYNLLWGAVVVIAPDLTLHWAGLAPPLTYPQIWQCLGMVVGVYGIGYLIAAGDPYRHWPIVFVGLLGKLLGPIGFLASVLVGTLPLSMGWTILLNDLVWWIPFAMMLWGAFRSHQAVTTVHATESIDDDPVRELLSSTGHSLYELSAARPRLVVFLRHTGCTFCREALADLQQQRPAIEETGTGIVLVHLGDEEQVAPFLARFGLDDLPRFSDPTCRLYRQFGLDLGGFRQLLGLKVWLRGLKAGCVDGHGMGAIRGNPFQMPGAFVLDCGRFVGGFQHEAASDRPDYVKLVREALPATDAVAV